MGDAFFYVPEKGDHNPTPLHHYGAQVNNADSLYTTLDSSNVILKELKAHMHLREGGGNK